MKIYSEHLADLKESGLKRRTIKRARLRSISLEEARQILGFVPRGTRTLLVFPYGPDEADARYKLFPAGLDEHGGKIKYWRKKGSRNRLYIPPGVGKLLQDISVPIYFAEGEKKALRAAQEGLCCVGISGIYGWKNTGSERLIKDIRRIPLKGRAAIIVPDADFRTNVQVGSGTKRFWKALQDRSAKVRVKSLPSNGAGEKVGLDDYLELASIQEFLRLPEIKREHDLERIVASHISLPSPKDWPKDVHRDALIGIAGDLVRLIAPHTEADPAALLINVLVAVGNMVGDGAHLEVGQTKHPLRLFGTLVGATSSARKGTSWNDIRSFLEMVDPGWVKDHVQSGLSSGEGIISAVRDKSYEINPIRKKGRIVDYQDEMIDKGVDDKRLLIAESEFARTLLVMRRDGNILSTVLRDAWDTGNLRVMTKVATAATGAHISILAHITQEELKRTFDTMDMANGFANRFLWMLVRRSQMLPEGGRPDKQELKQLARKFKRAVEFGSAVGRLDRTPNAKILWARLYPELTRDRFGLIGAIEGRAAVQVLRLAGIYAVLDQSALVRTRHLKAATAVWRRVEDSIRVIFSNRSGNKVADKIHGALLHGGKLSRTKISALFSRHIDRDEIDAALRHLVAAGLVKSSKARTDGRSLETWRIARAKEEKEAKEPIASTLVMEAA